VVDPLHVDGAQPGTSFGPAEDSSIDPRAVGPYRLTGEERRDLRLRADKAVECMRDYSIIAQVREWPSGRPTVEIQTLDVSGAAEVCGHFGLLRSTKTEEKALTELTNRTSDCLRIERGSAVVLPSFELLAKGLPAHLSRQQIQECVEASRRSQLKPYVAPPALLFVTDPDRGIAGPSVSLPRANLLQIVGAAGLVLAVAVLVTVGVGVRLVRPLRMLADAARRPVDEQRRVPVTTRDEIGQLATALNDLSDRRRELEQQRKAMVNDVAHELRTPLTNIRSWLEAAQDGLASVDGELLELVLEEAVLLQHVIDDLRDLAAADADNLRIHPERVYLNDVLSHVIDAHRGAADAAGVRLTTQYTGDPQVEVDPARLRQLVANLVSNAVRHTPHGGDVTVRTTMVDRQHIIDVADTGSGIAHADLTKIFDRFWRSDASRSRTTGGSGLGLSIARKLAEAHGGGITVVSEIGVGSTFTVRLPM
jgi:two-component system sensor histidine kinase BaeS